MKKKKSIFIFIVVVILVFGVVSVPIILKNSKKNSTVKAVVESQHILGAGGYGAVFNAQIDPYNENNYAFTCDMGSAYFSYDAGKSWTSHNFKGTLYCLKYDTSTKGVVWVAGSGVYKSIDHGRNFKMVFPKEEEITSSGNNYENANYWLYTDKKSDYAPHYQIWSLAINRNSQGKNVFVGQRIPSTGLGYNKCIRVYQTINGEDFRLFTELEYSENYKLDYDEVNDCLLYITPQRIMAINKEAKLEYTVDMPVYVQFVNGNNMCFSSYYDIENNKNTYVFSTPTEQEHLASICYKTNDLKNKSSYLNLSAELLNLTTDDFGIDKVEAYNEHYPSYEYCEWINGKTVPQQFKWTICEASVLNDDVVYLFHEANTNTYDANGNFYVKRRTMIYLKYDKRQPAKKQFKWIFGFPLKPYNKYIENVTWQDSDSDYCFGMSSYKDNDDSLLYCSNVGIYYTSDGQTVKQLNSNIVDSKSIEFKSKDGQKETKTLQALTTTGVDVICTHKVATDPFDKNHLLICSTDIGLIQSYDNGNSWLRALYEWQDGTLKNINYAEYTNTCFDVHFDKEKQGVVYGLWSQTKTAPYTPNNSYLTGQSRFGVSYDGGLSWEMKPITENGQCQPFRMQVVYKKNKREIYITTDGNGFFKTTDLGENFTEMNAGIEASTINGKKAIWGNEILVCEKGIFAVTGGSATDQNSQMLYKWNDKNNCFEKIGLPKVEYDNKIYNPAAIRDIIYDDNNDCLYLACVATNVTNYKELIHIAGGIWKYQDGEFVQIYDDAKSVCSLNLDSMGRLYATEMEGCLIRYDSNNITYEILVDGMFHRLKSIWFGAADNTIYVPTWGGGTYRIVLKEIK